VLAGLVLICAGMVPLTMLHTDTSFWTTTLCFFVMGLGMGMTMMPTMTAALRTLREHQIARGSTLMNITQQVAASIGTAVMSVLLTTFLKRDPFAPLAILANTDKTNGTAALAHAAQQSGVSADVIKAHGLQIAADSFAKTITIALILVACTAIPALFLPRTRAERPTVPTGETALEAA
jgi:MFS family permease